MPSVTASITIAAAPEKVWAVVSDVANAQRWNKAWNRIEMLTESHEGRGTRFRAFVADDDGNDEAYDFEITEWIAPEFIVFTPVRDPGEEQYQITLDWHSFRIEPLDEGATRVDLTARATSRGVRGRIVALLLWSGHQKPGLEEALKSLAETVGDGTPAEDG